MKLALLIILFVSSAWATSDSVATAEVAKSHPKENVRLQKDLREGNEIDSSKYTKGFKEAYWEAYSKKADVLLKADKKDDELDRSHKQLIELKSGLEGLEWREGEVDALYEKVEQHLKQMGTKDYKLSTQAFIDLVFWQKEASLKTASGKHPLIVTNKAYCAGGARGYENSSYHFFVDGCLFWGYGNVGSEKTNFTYHQSNISNYGFKVSPSAGMFVSSTKVEVGFKLPLLYSNQSLSEPSGSKLKEGSPFMALASFYSRWPFQKWFVQTEFAKGLNRDTTLWSLGAGYKF